MVVRLVEVHQRHKVVQISLVLNVENLILVVVHLMCISKLREFLEKVFTLLFLNLELAILNVEVEDPPNICTLELWNQLIHAISGDVWHITVVTSEQVENLGYLGLDLRYLLSKLLITSNGQRLDNDVENPFSFLLNLLWTWVESASDLDLELLWNVFFSDLDILSSSKEVINVFRHKLVLESLVSVFVSCRRLSSLFEDLLLDGSLLVDFLLLDGGAIDLLIIRIMNCGSNLFEFSWSALVLVDQLQILFIELLLGI